MRASQIVRIEAIEVSAIICLADKSGSTGCGIKRW
jgi:hypothetical protein